MMAGGCFILALLASAGFLSQEPGEPSPGNEREVIALLEDELQHLNQLLKVVESGGVPELKNLEGDSLENRIRILQIEEESLHELRAALEQLKKERSASPKAEKRDPAEPRASKEDESQGKPPSGEIPGEISEEKILDLLRLANALFAQKKYPEALETYKKASHLSTLQEDWILFQEAGCLAKLGDLEAAERSYQKLQKEFPRSFWASQAEWDLQYIGWKRSLGSVALDPLAEKKVQNPSTGFPPPEEASAPRGKEKEESQGEANKKDEKAGKKSGG